MKPYTVISDYSATGEGRTVSIWIGYAESEEDACWRFANKVWQGTFFVTGATVSDCFDLSHPIAQELVSKDTMNRLGRFFMPEFSAQLHYNI